MHHTNRPESPRTALPHAKIWSAIAVGFAVAAITTLLVEPPARASLPPAPEHAMTEPLPAIVEGTVGQADSTCNVEVFPGGVVTIEAQDVEIELAMAQGVTIEGWDCEDDLCVYNVSAERIAYDGVVWLEMEIDNGDPNHVGGAWMFVTQGDKEEFSNWNCYPRQTWGGKTILLCDDGTVISEPPPSTCCACPCDFAPSCH